MNGFFDFYTILFLVLAVAIFLRLRSVLGRRTGTERPPFDPYSAQNANGAGEKVVTLPRRGDEPARGPSGEPATPDWGDIAPAGTPLASGLTAIRGADPAFDPDGFLQGARAAYEMIVTAFAEGDRKTLKSLLGRDVYDGFVGAISEREARGETAISNFVGIDKAAITDAALRGKMAHVTIRFVSKLVTATHDKDGNVIQGDPHRVTEVTDIWTFARDVTSRDPNWKLVATEAGE